LDVETAKKRLNRVLTMKEAVPYKKFKESISHRPGIGPGKFPQKSSAAILALIEGAEANAQFKGLNVNSLVITHICAKKGSNAWHYGRKGGRHMKRTHVEIVLEEVEKTEKPKKKVREVKK
jgi:large subunit ribosomal protein L22